MITLDSIRAKEILNTTNMVNVTYNGTPIYIESINDHKGTANIHPLDQTKNIQVVPLTDLIEH